MGLNHSKTDTRNNNNNNNNNNNETTKANSKIKPEDLQNNKNKYEQNFEYLLNILKKTKNITNFETTIKNQTDQINKELQTKTEKLTETTKSNDDYYLTRKKIYNEVNENVNNYNLINSILGYSLVFLFVILLLLLSIKILGGKI
jgi:predicted RND superfamily exporter protein